MNLSYVRNYLETYRENMTIDVVNTLIDEIKAYQGTENKLTDIASIMNTINSYNTQYLTQVQEYETYKKDDMKQLPLRAEKAREILCTLSSLHTYLILSTANITESTFNMKNLRTYVTLLNEKKEHFKSEKITWVTILRSLTQEMAFSSEMRRLDIEDKVGYLKYKDN